MTTDKTITIEVVPTRKAVDRLTEFSVRIDGKEVHVQRVEDWQLVVHGFSIDQYAQALAEAFRDQVESAVATELTCPGPEAPA